MQIFCVVIVPTGEENNVVVDQTKSAVDEDIIVLQSAEEVPIEEGTRVEHPTTTVLKNHQLPKAKAVNPDWSILLLAFQSLGIVYGDIGTSPLYVFSNTFPDGIKNNDDVVAVLSLIIYTLTLIPLIKYVFIALQATNNGEGGTFALYSLICRYAKVSLGANQHIEDEVLSDMEFPNKRLLRASRLKSKLENSKFSKLALLLLTMLCTSMVISDGVLTPCISVLSAVEGIKQATSKVTEGMIVWASVVILIFLFLGQRFGTEKVGYTFAPIVFVWFILIATIGAFNIWKFERAVLIKATNPKYILYYFGRNKVQAWISFGGIVLTTTGAEALFADVGHFTVASIQISMCAITYPSLLFAYAGQAAYLRKHNAAVSDAFFKSIPGSMYWPTFFVAVMAAIIASQAMISGTFSIVHQSISFGCFPRVKVVHTSKKHKGQIYLPEINFFLLLACVGITLVFRSANDIGNAYGIAMVSVMILTSGFLVIIMILVWKTRLIFIIMYVSIIGTTEALYLSAVLYKFNQGGYLPLAFVAVLMSIMYIWHNVHHMAYMYLGARSFISRVSKVGAEYEL